MFFNVILISQKSVHVNFFTIRKPIIPSFHSLFIPREQENVNVRTSQSVLFFLLLGVILCL
ncbi:hypothetical protein ZYGNAAKF_CDS0180 [Enterococcus phage VRE9_2]